MDMQPSIDSAEQLTHRAEWFISSQCVRVESPGFEKLGDQWLEFGIPAAHVDRMLDFQRRWGGLVLPPYAEYEGGPKMLWCEMPAEQPERAGWFYAGLHRVSMAYSFMIGPAGEFAIDEGPWVPLHASIEGWIESVALAHHASTSAQKITTIRGHAIDDLPPRAFEPVPEVRGLADTWWRGPDSLIAIHTGEAVGFDKPRLRVARVYDGGFVRRL
ncbi:hypothetical protein [Nocardia sp. NPDC057030]|uniref:hypothetical protein n=1 Tax=unclassified Nocardia TaxID=2637762 RepID=UPI003624B90A